MATYICIQRYGLSFDILEDSAKTKGVLKCCGLRHNFVRDFLGEIEAEIFRFQKIKNARFLLLVPDNFEFFEIECDD